MNEIQIFKNEQFGEIRTIEINGQPYFAGKDVAKALGGYSDTKKAIKQHCKEDGGIICPLIDRLGRIQQVKFINEGNLYRLIIHSHLPSSEKFERWIFEDVLPTIRRTGSYGNRNLSDEKLYAELKVMERKIDALEKKVDAIEEQSFSLVKDVVDAIIVPGFNGLHNKIESTSEKSDRNIIRSVSENVKLLGTYIDTLIKKIK